MKGEGDEFAKPDNMMGSLLFARLPPQMLQLFSHGINPSRSCTLSHYLPFGQLNGRHLLDTSRRRRLRISALEWRESVPQRVQCLCSSVRPFARSLAHSSADKVASDLELRREGFAPAHFRPTGRKFTAVVFFVCVHVWHTEFVSGGQKNGSLWLVVLLWPCSRWAGWTPEENTSTGRASAMGATLG